MFYDFTNAFVDPDFWFSAQKNLSVWLEGFDAKQVVFVRKCLFGKNCKYQLRFRPRIDGDDDVWVIESSEDHSHDELSKSRFHDLAVEHGVEKGLTAQKAIVQLRRDFHDLVFPEGFARTIENMQSHESKTGKTANRQNR